MNRSIRIGVEGQNLLVNLLYTTMQKEIIRTGENEETKESKLANTSTFPILMSMDEDETRT